jgi:hypothetical protein
MFRFLARSSSHSFKKKPPVKPKAPIDLDGFFDGPENLTVPTKDPCIVSDEFDLYLWQKYLEDDVKYVKKLRQKKNQKKK